MSGARGWRVVAWGLLGVGLSFHGLAAPGTKDADWVPSGEKDGIRVFRRKVPGLAFDAFRGQGVVEAPLGKVLAVLADNTHRTEWVDRLKKSEVLEVVSAHESFIHQVFKLPPLVSNRDYVYHARTYREVGSRRVIVELRSEPHPRAPKPEGIRAELRHSGYILEALDSGRTQVTVEIETDPKGWLPGWLVNLIQKSWPVKTINGIRKQVQKPHIRAYPMPPFSTASPPLPASSLRKADP